MARLAVSDIMNMVSSTVNQSNTGPTAGGTEWTLWLSFINKAVYDWATTHDWEDLRQTNKPAITSLTQASVGLPQNFSKLAGNPKHWGTGITGGESWPIIIPEEVSLYNTTEKWAYVSGDISAGFYLTWNPGTLASGASLSIPYYSTPTSLASPAQIPIIPDSLYLVERTIGYIFESRSDARFQEMEAKSRERLLTMIEANDAAKYDAHSQTKTPVRNTLRLQSFRVGRD